MSKIILFVLLLYAGVTNADGQIKDCNVGSDPWFLNRPVLVTDVVWTLSKPLIADSLSGKGGSSGNCRLLPGEQVIVPLDFNASVSHPFATREEKMKLAWIRRCGNPIVSKFRFVASQTAEATPVASVQQVVVEAPQKGFYETAVFPENETIEDKPVRKAPTVVGVVVEKQYVPFDPCRGNFGLTGTGPCGNVGYPIVYGGSRWSSGGGHNHHHHQRRVSPPSVVAVPPAHVAPPSVVAVPPAPVAPPSVVAR
ncbi:MAG: hypothetical protein WC791_01585 [Candidatus Paceibacterota bacterium]|jgi:hypothetical protein